MIVNIDGIWFERKACTSFRVKAIDLGHGHIEASAKQSTYLQELQLTSKEITALESAQWNKENDPVRIKERLERALKMSANRAKTRVRRLCKVMGCDTMLTLSYRANELDIARCKADLKAFNRRMLKLLPAFGFVAAFERQERGAWHVHIATSGIPSSFKRVNSTGQIYKVKSFDVIRALWRGVTKERGGTINLSRRKRHSLAGSAKIAAYLSKYMLKAFEDGVAFSNRYTSYGAPTADLMPKNLDFGLFSCARDAVAACYDLIGAGQVFSQHFDSLNGWFFVHSENPLKRR